jgi:hypothetical protein
VAFQQAFGEKNAAFNPVEKDKAVEGLPNQGCIKLQEPRGVGVVEISNPPAPLRFLQPADWKSAIQQSGTLRYFPSMMQPCGVMESWSFGVLD